MSEAQTTENAPALDEDFGLHPGFVQAVLDALDAGDAVSVKRLADELHSADLADLLGLLRPHERRDLIQILGQDLDPDVLPELEADVRDQIVQELHPQALAAALSELESDDAIYLLEDLPKERQSEILKSLPEADRAAVELGLQSEEGTAGRLMQREFITVPSYWTVGQVIDYLRETDDLPDEFYEIYVVDAAHHAIGSVTVSQLMRNRRPVMVGDIMETEPTLVPIDTDQEEIAYLFDQYHLVSAAVVDADNRVVGMLTVDDVVEIIQEEHEEDLFSLSGVRDESLGDSVLVTARRRFSWLLINLISAIMASVVIAFFGATIEQIVALAILMPIVASMGGNAGTQTLTVAVRALATRDLTPTNTLRIVLRETMVGFMSGIIFAVLMGIVAGVWFSGESGVFNLPLALIIGTAMIINLVCAGLAGILIPIGLQRAGADPAISSTVFVTTVTDVVGFFVFLGLAAWWVARSQGAG